VKKFVLYLSGKVNTGRADRPTDCRRLFGEGELSSAGCEPNLPKSWDKTGNSNASTGERIKETPENRKQGAHNRYTGRRNSARTNTLVG